MGKELVVKGCTFKASISPGSITANCSTTTQPSDDDLVSGKGIYFDKITVTIPTGASVKLPSPPSGATSSTGQLMAPDTIDIKGTANDVLDGNGNKAVLKGDNGSKTVTFTFPAPQGTVTTYGVNVKVEVDNPGQTDVIAL